MEMMSRANIRLVNGVVILRYAYVSIALWCILPALALGLAWVCWRRASALRRRSPDLPQGVVGLRIAAVFIALFSIIIAAIVVPGVALHEVRISGAELTQSTGLWFKSRVRRFPLSKISVIFRSTAPGEFGRRAIWNVRYRTGGGERFEPSELIAMNADPVVIELQARGVTVIPPVTRDRRRE
jgi:hypothetical protein